MSDRVLTELLEMAGLPQDLGKVIKHLFRFSPIPKDETFSHHSIFGRCEGLEIGPAGRDFRFDSGIREFSAGSTLIWLGFDRESGWGALVKHDSTNKESMYSGTMEIF